MNAGPQQRVTSLMDALGRSVEQAREDRRRQVTAERDVIDAAEQYEEAHDATRREWGTGAGFEARENAHIALIAAVRAMRKGAGE